MKNESKSKKIKHITFFIYVIGTVLFMSIRDMFDKQMQLFVHSIKIFSNLPDSLINFLYVFLMVLVLGKICQKSAQYFSKKYNVSI